MRGRRFRVALRLRRGVAPRRVGGPIGRVRDGVETRGAKVDGVALGLSALGVETADGAALGLKAFGLTEDAAALGLMEFGPVAAGAEPGDGMNTPWLKAGPAEMMGSRQHAAIAKTC